LLRARRERPSRGRAAYKAEELSPPHMLTEAESYIIPARAALCSTAKFGTSMSETGN
jgi:hypothetical protein